MKSKKRYISFIDGKMPRVHINHYPKEGKTIEVDDELWAMLLKTDRSKWKIDDGNIVVSRTLPRYLWWVAAAVGGGALLYFV